MVCLILFGIIVIVWFIGLWNAEKEDMDGWSFFIGTIAIPLAIAAAMVTNPVYHLRYEKVAGVFMSGDQMIPAKWVRMSHNNYELRGLTMKKDFPVGELYYFNEPDGALPLEADGKQVVVVQDRGTSRMLTTSPESRETILLPRDNIIREMKFGWKYWEWDVDREIIQLGHVVEYIYR